MGKAATATNRRTRLLLSDEKEEEKRGLQSWELQSYRLGVFSCRRNLGFGTVAYFIIT